MHSCDRMQFFNNSQGLQGPSSTPQPACSLCASVLHHASFAPKSKNDALSARLRIHLTQEFRSIVSQCTMFSQRNRELHKAIKEGNYAQVIQCLDVGPKRERAKVDQVDGTGWLPLARAADHGHTRICAALLDRGAAVDQSSELGHNLTPLYLACRFNQFETAELLIARGANMEFVNRENGYVPLHVACLQGNINLVQLLLDQGADAKQVSRNGHKPLQLASCQGHVDVAEMLIAAGADVNLADNKVRRAATRLQCPRPTSACRVLQV